MLNRISSTLTFLFNLAGFFLALTLFFTGLPGLASPAPGLVLSGSVEVAAGTPLAGAEALLLPVLTNYEHQWLRLAEEVPVASAKAVSDEQGRFQIGVPRSGVWKVRLRHEGFVTAEYPLVAMADSIVLPPLVLEEDVSSAVELFQASGAPVSAAWIVARRSQEASPAEVRRPTDGWRAAPRSGWTDENGRLTLPRATDEWLDLAIHPAAHSDPLQVLGVEGLRWVLESPPRAPSRQNLVIHNAVGKPVAGVLICVGEEARPVAATDAEGRWTLLAPPLAASRLRLLTADGGNFVHHLEGAESSAEAPPIPLPEHRTVTGLVVDAASRRPLRQVLVWPSHDPGQFTYTDIDGQFELPLPSAGQSWIQAHARGFMPRGLSIDSRTPRVDLSLSSATAFVGQVVDTRGRALSAVRVAAVPAERLPFFLLDRAEARAFSDPAGEFRISRLQAAGTYRILANKTGYLPTTKVVDLALVTQAARFVLRAAEVEETPDTTRLSGLVVDQDLAPVAGARVLLTTASPEPGTVDVLQSSPRDLDTRTDEMGLFLFKGLAPGAYVTIAEAGGFQPSTPREVSLLAGDLIEGLRLELRPGAYLEGWTLRSDGEPLVEALVRSGDHASFSDQQGKYRLDGLAPGLHQVEASHRLLASVTREVDLAVGENAFDLTFPAGDPLGGRVIDLRGLPVALARIDLRAEFGSQQHQTQSALDGSFHVNEMAGGRYRMNVSKDGYATTETELRVGGATTEDLEVVLKLGGIVRGRILGLGSTDLSSLEVQAERNNHIRAATIDGAGLYTLRGLGDGEWLLRARAQGGARQTQARVQVKAAEESHQDLEFSPGLVLSGLVLLAGEPLAKASVRISHLDRADIQHQIETDLVGGFVLQDLAAGVYRVETSHARELLVDARDLDLHSDLDLRIELRFVRVGGRILSADDEPLADALVIFQQLPGGGRTPRGSRFTVGTGARGQFLFARLTPGNYWLTALKEGYLPIHEKLEISSDLETLEYVLRRSEEQVSDQ